MALAPHNLEEFDADLPAVEPPPPPVEGTLSRTQKAARLVMKFVFGQGAAQGLAVLANIFLIHKLSIEAYAQYGLATGFQTVFLVLMDLGFATTIVPMIGDRREDAALVGRYVRSARHIRMKLFWLLSPAAAVAFWVIMRKHHWSPQVQILLLASVLLSLYSAGKVSYFSAPLFVFGRLKEYYFPQVITGSGRLILYFFLSAAKGLNAWIAAGLGALNITINGLLIEKNSKKYFEWPEHESPETERELIRYILPASPAMIFAAFQTQISLFLVSLLGGTTGYIAEVAALNRIGQLSTVLITFFNIIVEPYFARTSRNRLLKVFLTFLTLMALGCIPFVLLAYFWPQAYVWVLGEKYSDLTSVMGPYILSLCIATTASLMWVMNRSRKWVFWSGSILEVLLLLGVQGIYLWRYGVRNTQQAVNFGLASSFCYLIAHGYVAIYGFRQNRRSSVS
jgi:O-antigen/teichoic acid export membrane protein